MATILANLRGFVNRVASTFHADIARPGCERARRSYLDALHEHVMAADKRAMAAALGADTDAEVRRQVLALLDLAGRGVPAVDPIRVMASPIGGPQGRGVFAAADIGAGRVVGLYPGRVYSARKLRELGGSAAIDPHGENEYLMFRMEDGTCYDASTVAGRPQ